VVKCDLDIGPLRKNNHVIAQNIATKDGARASAFGGARGHADMPKIVDWSLESKINIDDLITHKRPLERIIEGFDLIHEGKSIRAVVEC